MKTLPDGTTVKTKTWMDAKGKKHESVYFAPRVEMGQLDAYLSLLRAKIAKGGEEGKNAALVLRAVRGFVVSVVADNTNVLKAIDGGTANDAKKIELGF